MIFSSSNQFGIFKTWSVDIWRARPPTTIKKTYEPAFSTSRITCPSQLKLASFFCLFWAPHFESTFEWKFQNNKYISQNHPCADGNDRHEHDEENRPSRAQMRWDSHVSLFCSTRVLKSAWNQGCFAMKLGNYLKNLRFECKCEGNATVTDAQLSGICHEYMVSSEL